MSRHASLESLKRTIDVDVDYEFGERTLEPSQLQNTSIITNLHSLRLLPQVKKPQKVTLEGILGGPGTHAADNSTYLRRNYHKVGNEVGTRDLILEVI